MVDDDVFLMISMVIPASITCYLTVFTDVNPLPTTVISLVFLCKYIERHMDDPPSWGKLWLMFKNKFKQGLQEYHQWRNHVL